MMELYDFYADWCGPCQMMKPVMEEFKTKHKEIKVRTINIDDEGELAEKYSVSGIPCLVFLKNGEEVDRIVGVTSIKKLEKVLEKQNA